MGIPVAPRASELVHPAKVWWFVYSGEGDAAWNMAVDEWLLSTAHTRPPVLRFYGWSSPTISLGRNEVWKGVVDPERCREAQVSLVRRPTGGRAVLHHREITYSVTAPIDGEGWSARLESALALVSAALVRGLLQLGVPASFSRRAAGHLSPSGTACFESMTRYELSVGGVKAVGSAQCRTDRAFLQHGSIPLSPTLETLWKLGPQGRPRPVDPMPAELLALAGRPLEPLCRTLALGFEEECGQPGKWQGQEFLNCEEIEALVGSKYETAEWTLRR